MSQTYTLNQLWTLRNITEWKCHPSYILPPCHLPHSRTQGKNEKSEWIGRFSLFWSVKSPSFKKIPLILYNSFSVHSFCVCLSVCLEKPWFASRMISEPGNLNYLYQALTKMAIVKKSEMISQWQWKQCNCKEDVKMPGLAMLICCVEMGQAFLISGCSIRPLLESQDRLNLCHQTICRGH